MKNRRNFIQQWACGTLLSSVPGIVAHSSLYAADSSNAQPKVLHHPGKVKSVIFYFCKGGPSQGHTFDPPKKIQDESLHPFKFSPAGKSGLQISEVFPALKSVADELCVIKSGYGAKATHNEGGQYILTASSILKASLGSWMLYGMGSGNTSLPGYMVLSGRVPGDNWCKDDGNVPGGAKSTSSGGLPPSLQAQMVRNLKEPISNLRSLFKGDDQARWLSELEKLNARYSQRHQHVPELNARSESFLHAEQMQTAAPEAFDLSKEEQNKEIRKLYGLDSMPTKSTGTKLLLARRLVERGVRFVVVPSSKVPNLDGGVADWDTHTPTQMSGGIPNLSKTCDQPLTGLIQDLKQRRLLDQTLVIWGGEMGRGGKGFLNHNGSAFTWWMAGGGVPGGTTYGETDELGYSAVEKPIHVRDLHATILWKCGLDYRKLNYNGVGLEESCKVAMDLV
jgi:hypothetical protein